jgi:hypothetical protein
MRFILPDNLRADRVAAVFPSLHKS